MTTDPADIARLVQDLARTPGAARVDVEGTGTDDDDRPARLGLAFLPPDWPDPAKLLRRPVEATGFVVSGALLVAGLSATPDGPTVLELVRQLRRQAGVGGFPFRVACTRVDVRRAAWLTASRARGYSLPAAAGRGSEAGEC